MGQPQYAGQPNAEEQATAAYLDYWVANIDQGLQSWSTFGLATTRALLFDPQSKRDLQNKESVSEGPDAVDPAFKTHFSFSDPLTDPRSAAENDFGILDTFLDELNDPNNDGETDDSFTNQTLMPMLGIPRRFGDLKAGIESFLDTFEDKILRPTRELLQDVPSPLDLLVDFIKDKIVEYIKEEARKAIFDATGLDINVIEFLLDQSPSDLLGLKSITINGVTTNLFQPTDHDRLDYIMGFRGTDFTELLDTDEIEERLDKINAEAQELDPAAMPIEIEFYEGARGHLKPNVEFDKAKFYPYANSVTLSKMLLLQETLPNGQAPIGGFQPKTISHLLSDLISDGADALFYNFTLLTQNATSSGGDIMSATLPGAMDALVSRPALQIYARPGHIGPLDRADRRRS